jgi:hypothetical protein
VEGGQLMCSYHGWKFTGEGGCTSIPQALDSKAQAAALDSPRSCATALPTQVRSCVMPRSHAQSWCLAAMSGTTGTGLAWTDAATCQYAYVVMWSVMLWYRWRRGGARVRHSPPPPIQGSDG